MKHIVYVPMIRIVSNKRQAAHFYLLNAHGFLDLPIINKGNLRCQLHLNIFLRLQITEIDN